MSFSSIMMLSITACSGKTEQSIELCKALLADVILKSYLKSFFSYHCISWVMSSWLTSSGDIRLLMLVVKEG